MILDIIIIVIFLISILRGKSNGFGQSLIKLARLVVAVILGIALAPQIADGLKVTTLDERIYERLSNYYSEGALHLLEMLPVEAPESLVETGFGTIKVQLESFTNLCLTVIGFVGVIVVVWLIGVILIHSLKRERKKGSAIGKVDSGMGFLVGAIKGAILVFLFLALMFPFAGVFMPDKVQALNEMLNHSFIAGPLYDIDPLIAIIRKITL